MKIEKRDVALFVLILLCTFCFWYMTTRANIGIKTNVNSSSSVQVGQYINGKEVDYTYQHKITADEATLSGVAETQRKRNNPSLTYLDIIDANPQIKNPDVVCVGQELTIPVFKSNN